MVYFGAIKLVRPLTQNEVKSILEKNGKKEQGWADKQGNKAENRDYPEGFDPNITHANYKLADAVTYDENGNVIPLSQRMNLQSNNVNRMYTDSRGIGIPVSDPVVDYSGPVPKRSNDLHAAW